MDDRYTYHIHPHKTITNIIPGKGIRRPMGLKLTKDEVIKCMACGPVYRVFPGIPPIRVTGSNLDSLHVSLEEYTRKEEKTTPTDSPEKAPEVAPTESTVAEEPKNDTLTEEIVEEKPVEEVIESDNFVEVTEEEKVEEIIEEVPVEEEASVVVGFDISQVEDQTTVETPVEEITSEEDSDDDEEEEYEEVEEEVTPSVDQNGHTISNQPHYKKKKRRH